MSRGMKYVDAPQLNLLVAWVWIFLGFLSGFAMGIKFHEEGWLGGYASFKRRMLRLGHISFFGLGAVNFMFYLTAHAQMLSGAWLQTAGWSFALGALSMPLVCCAMAFHAKCRPLFLIPVGSLISGAVFTLIDLATL